LKQFGRNVKRTFFVRPPFSSRTRRPMPSF
jgi:hypothetical protein